MYFSKAAITFTTLSLLGFASAGCYSGGQKADSASMETVQKKESLEKVCAELDGEYHQGRKVDTCLNIGDGSYTFEIVYVGDAGYRTMGTIECMDGLKKEAKCSFGGKTEYDNWQYRVDYQKGACAGEGTIELRSEARSHPRDFTVDYLQELSDE